MPSPATASVGARQYLSTAGRFLQPDPLMDPYQPATLNAYTYSQNNPVTLSDPTGLTPGGMGGGISDALGKGLNRAAPKQATPQISLAPYTPNGDEIVSAVNAWAKRNGFAFDSGDAGIDSRNQVHAFAAVCANDGNNLCGNAMTDFFLYLEWTFNAAGVDRPILDDIVVGGDSTPGVPGIDMVALIADIGMVAGSYGSGGVQAFSVGGGKRALPS